MISENVFNQRQQVINKETTWAVFSIICQCLVFITEKRAEETKRLKNKHSTNNDYNDWS